MITENPSCRIWVGGLPPRFQEEDLFNLFKRFGRIVHHNLVHSSRDTYGFVQFDSEQDSLRAIEEMNGYDVRPGRPIKVSTVSEPSNPSGNRRRARSRSLSPGYVRNGDNKRRDAGEQHQTTTNDRPVLSQSSVRQAEDQLIIRRRGGGSSKIVCSDVCLIENIPDDFTEEELVDIGKSFGSSFLGCKLWRNSYDVPCGVLDYENEQDLVNAINGLDKKRIEGGKYRLITFREPR